MDGAGGMGWAKTLTDWPTDRPTSPKFDGVGQSKPDSETFPSSFNVYVTHNRSSFTCLSSFVDGGGFTLCQSVCRPKVAPIPMTSCWDFSWSPNHDAMTVRSLVPRHRVSLPLNWRDIRTSYYYLSIVQAQGQRSVTVSEMACIFPHFFPRGSNNLLKMNEYCGLLFPSKALLAASSDRQLVVIIAPWWVGVSQMSLWSVGWCVVDGSD